MASQKTESGATIYSGGGRHGDKRRKRKRTRKAAADAAIKDQQA